MTVPDNVPVEVTTSSGDVASSGLRGSVSSKTGSGGVAADGWCGFTCRPAPTRATSRRRRLLAAAPGAALARGAVQALVPAGRYRVDAESDEGKRSVRGVTTGDDAPYQVQALCTTGDVRVGSGP